MKTQAALRAPLVASAILLAAMTVPTHAQESDSRRYVGVQYANLDFDLGGDFVLVNSDGDVVPDSGGDFDLDWTTPALMVNVGYQINPYFAVEGRAGIGVGDDDDDDSIVVDVSGTPTPFSASVDAEIESYFGVFGRVGMPAGEVFYPYIQVGYGSLKLDSAGADGTDEDFAYGIGANFKFTETMSGNLEYMNYYDDDDEEISGFSLGLRFDF